MRKLAEGAAILGNVPVRVGAPRGYDRSRPYAQLYDEAVDAYGKALEVLKAAGQTAIIEIHGGTIMVSASLAHRIVSRFAPADIGVIYDANNMAKDGFETFRIGMELLGPYLKHCHAGGWRPVAGDRKPDGTLPWKYEGCDLSDSILDIPQFMADLQAVGYNGFVSIEDFRAMDYERKLAPQLAYLKRPGRAVGAMAAGRIPDYFDLERYGIGAAEVVRQTLGCDLERIRRLVVLAPTWSPGVLADHVDRCESVCDGFVKVDDVTSGGLSFSYIRSGVGASQAGDAALALGCTACSHILFIGSVGGLSEKEQVGDVIVPTHSITGDGFSGYLAQSSAGPAPPPEPEARPDADFQGLVNRKAREACGAAGVAIHSGPVYSIDTIVAQFQHLPWMIDRFGCIGIEMETAAVFRAARFVGIRAAALLQFSDVIPMRKSLFSGRTQAERNRYREIRKAVLGRAVVAALQDAAASAG